jgi:hypothetical protein
MPAISVITAFPLKAMSARNGPMHGTVFVAGNAPHAGYPATSSRDTVWFVVDSGANLHLVKSDVNVLNPKDAEITIQGISDEVAGSFTGSLRGSIVASNGDTMEVEMEVCKIPNLPFNLFSVPTAVMQGHEVVHAGRPDSGRHGLWLNSEQARKFIPFVWCRDSNLWWLGITPENLRLRAGRADTCPEPTFDL